MKKWITSVGALVAMMVMLGMADAITRKYLHQPHWQWYLAGAPLISILGTLIVVAWPDERTNEAALISADPAEYIAAWVHMMGVTVFSLGTAIRTEPIPGQGERRSVSRLDALLAFPYFAVILPILIAWTLLILPAQYFVYVICGAPSRLFASNPREAVWKYVNGRVEVQEMPATGEAPEGWTASKLRAQPLALTNAIAAFATYLASQVAANIMGVPGA
ncbi:hypothetical protein PHYC_02121 [Phycisphaerales bacterium]|nr:hypothetical protein PHYC_02121 [Phycisphaerales bacterium]